MFRFVEFEAVHWDFWQRCRVPLEAGVVTIVGANGSGKTTLLDGLRTLMGLKCSRRRDERHYLRHNKQPYAWLRAVLDNRRLGTRSHPFFPILDDRVTLACRVERKGGEWQRRYAVAEGALDLEALQASLGADDVRVQWLAPREYQRRLGDAGLSRAIAEVLALEQGETDKLCEKSPKALLELVFHVFEDRATLDRYEHARAEQASTKHQLDQLDVELARLKANAEQTRTRVQRLHDYQRRAAEREKLVGEWLPRVELHEQHERSREMAQRRHAQRRRREELVLQAKALRGQRNEHESARTRLEVDAEEARADRDRLRDELNAVNAQIKECDKALSERDTLRVTAAGAPIIEAETAARELQQRRQQLAQATTALQQAGDRVDSLRSELSALRDGQRPDPADVAMARRELQAAGIAHHALADAVEITDPGWQASVDALLVPYRHLIVLRKAADRDRAWAIGERLRLRHFIAAADPEVAAAPGSVLDAVRFRQPTPAWIGQLLSRTRLVEDVAAGARVAEGQDWVTRSGYWRERRGARHAAPDMPAFGRARLEAVQRLLRDAESQMARSAGEVEAPRERIEALQLALRAPGAQRELIERAETYAQAEADREHLIKQRRSAGEAYPKAEARERIVRKQVTEAVKGETAAQTLLKQAEDQLAELGSPADSGERGAVLRGLRERRAAWRASGHAHWLGRTANGALALQHGSSRTLRQTLQRLDDDLEERKADNDPVVEDQLQRLEVDIGARQEELDRRRGEHSRAVQATDDARGAYIGVLRESARRYARNVKQLAAMAQVEVLHTLPQIDNSEASLAQAGLEIRFSFDGKAFGTLNDGEASGGQQVIKSLVLLLALMMEDDRPGGFVFIDEPFAHLDIVNIGRVAKFLQVTKAQYLITTPVTHNRGVFDPATLVLQTLKKRPGDTWAPPIQQLHRAPV